MLELSIYLPGVWRIRKILAAGVLVALAATCGALVVEATSVATVAITVITLYRGFNLLRLVQGRMHEKYLLRVGLRTSLTLLVFQGVVCGLWAVADHLQPSRASWWVLIAALQLLVTCVVWFSTARHLRTTKVTDLSTAVADRDLPSISVCIPARNETLALEACLRSIIASDYPKMEILVLDDQSHDRTPDIIRSFAHDGVRFIKGKTPPQNWLAKNWAYQRLYEESSGELVVFCGVDVQFAPHTLRAMVLSMLHKQKQMLAVIPQNRQQQGLAQEGSVLLQPMRYAWELCLPRRLFRRPPVLSSCWIASRELVAAAGTFSAISRSITPESYFAKHAVQNDGYTFLQSNETLDLTSSKDVREQWDTAVRTRYPQLHRRPEFVLLLSLAELLTVILPAVVFWVALWQHHWLLAIVNLANSLILTWVYASVVQLTYHRFQLRGLFAFPLASVLDVCIRHLSMWRYEFSDVTWKGRTVTEPVMHVYPHLPPLE